MLQKRGVVKTVIVLLPVSFLFVLSGCTRNVPPPEDRSEILIRHLLRRISDLNHEIDKRENKCLEEQISLVKGQRVAHQNDPQGAIDRMSQYLLDGEAAIEEHNRKHPESPWADTKDVLRQLCGDCTKERAIRDLQLTAEAQQIGRVDSKK